MELIVLSLKLCDSQSDAEQSLKKAKPQLFVTTSSLTNWNIPETQHEKSICPLFHARNSILRIFT